MRRAVIQELPESDSEAGGPWCDAVEFASPLAWNGTRCIDSVVRCQSGGVAILHRRGTV